MNKNNTKNTCTATIKGTINKLMTHGLVKPCGGSETEYALTELGARCAGNPRVYAAHKAAMTRKTNKMNKIVSGFKRSCSAKAVWGTRKKEEAAKAIRVAAAKKAALTRKRRAAAKKAVQTRKANQQKALLGK